MNSVRNWLCGYARCKVVGNGTERFLSLLNSKNIVIWKVTPEEDGYCFNLLRTSVKELDALRKKTGSHLKVLEKHGLPYLIFRYRKRKFLVLGLLLCIGVIWYGSTFIWDIHVDGTAYYTEEEIRKRVEENYVTLGERKSEIDCDALEQKLREDFPELSWISCELTGTQLNIVVKETLDGTETIVDQDVPQDLVAAKEGTIVEIITRSGTPVKKRGETVQKGEVLISGTIYIYDDYDEVIETDYVTADGDVIAETEYSFSDSFALSYYLKEYTGESHKSIELQLFQLHIPVRLHGKDYRYYDEMQSTHTLRLGNSYLLPFSLTIIEQKEYTPVYCEYTTQEAQDKMQERIDHYLGKLQEKDVEIMENHVTIAVDNGECTAAGTIVTWERISYGVPIDIREQKADNPEDGGVQETQTGE